MNDVIKFLIVLYTCLRKKFHQENCKNNHITKQEDIIIELQVSTFIFQIKISTCRALARNKKIFVLHKLGSKIRRGSGGHCKTLSGFSGEPGGKVTGKITTSA